MYTELIFGASLKTDTPKEVIDTLRYMVGDIEQPEKLAFDSSRNPLIGGSHYFDTEKDNPRVKDPENGLSITNQFKLINAIKVAVTNNCQLFIATHCYPLIENFDVISLQHKKLMTGRKFIELVSKI